MKTLLFSIVLMQPVAPPPQICPAVDTASNVSLTCCTESSGRQCCSKSTDSRGRPTGCNC